MDVGGWDQLTKAEHHSLQERVDRDETWLLAGIPSSDP